VLLADMLAVGHDEAAELAAALGRPREPSERHPYFTNLDLYMPHHRLPDVGALDTIGGVCRAANVEPLIENVESRDSTFSHVWVGYMDDQTLVYHPGWLNYCVEMGGTVARGVMDALGSEGGES
ncbi:MAG TPA: hypothetical protein VHF51_17745, partial [Solirubrobacteraceae bacterium]|nr:hypothetical protein [Solirubrobacteraceae bacterium]